MLPFTAVKCRKMSEVTPGTLDIKSGPTRCWKGLWLQLMCCALFRLLSQDFSGMEVRERIRVVLRVRLREMKVKGRLIQYSNEVST